MEAVHRQVLVARDTPSATRLCGRVSNWLCEVSWNDAAQQLDGMSSLISDFVAITGQLCPEPVQESLEAFVARYGREISSNELTMAHVFLAEHCRHHHTFSSEIRNFSRLSDQLPPDPGVVGGYFMNSAKILCLNRRLVDEAAIAAALALTIEPSEQFYQHWCLHELVAYGSVTPLPKPVWGSKCGLVDGLAALFANKTVSNWTRVVQYVHEHEQALDERGLGPLARLAMATLAVKIVQSSLEVVCAMPTKELLPLILDTLSLEELVGAGLREVCRIDGDTMYPVYITGTKSSTQMLSETVKFAQALAL